jgi:hypothetical protein
MWPAQGILAALYERQRNRKGPAGSFKGEVQ